MNIANVLSIPHAARWAAIALITVVAATPCRAQEPATDPGPDYIIGPEDVLDVAVWNNTEITRTVPVRPDGKISLPLINEVQAAGLTARELQDVLIERFTEFIASPEVSVIVTDVRSLRVLAVDEVARPGLTRVPTRLPFQRFLPRPSTAPYWWDRG